MGRASAVELEARLALYCVIIPPSSSWHPFLSHLKAKKQLSCMEIKSLVGRAMSQYGWLCGKES